MKDYEEKDMNQNPLEPSKEDDSKLLKNIQIIKICAIIITVAVTVMCILAIVNEVRIKSYESNFKELLEPTITDEYEYDEDEYEYDEDEYEYDEDE